MKYQDILKIAKYLNEINRGKFTIEEVEENARGLWAEYNISLEKGKPTKAMVSLCNELYQDMDFMDYCDLPPFMNEIRTISEMVHVLKNAVDFI